MVRLDNVIVADAVKQNVAKRNYPDFDETQIYS